MTAASWRFRSACDEDLKEEDLKMENNSATVENSISLIFSW